MSINKQIYITSINKAVNKARATGKMDLKILAFFELYKYYIDFTQDKYIFKDFNIKLKSIISDLKYKYPKEICNYKTYLPTEKSKSTINNSVPTVSPVSINMLEEESIFLDPSYFNSNFTDTENYKPKNVILYLGGISGTFKYNVTVITNTLQIPIEEVSNIEYTRISDAAFTFNLPFRVSSDGPNNNWSLIVNNSLIGTIAGNQPPVVGDNTIIVDNRVTTVLTLPMFTSQLKPPYSDPELDLIDAIRLDSISNANLGNFYLNSVLVVEGQIITREDIVAGLFTHIGPNQDALTSDNFTFSARDEGSMIWVD